MSLTTNVRSGTSGSGTEPTGEVRDEPGGGGGKLKVEVIMSIEMDKIDSFGTPDPATDVVTQNDGTHYQVCWRKEIVSYTTYQYKVPMTPKTGAEGPTLIGFSVHATRDGTGDQLFSACTRTIYHASYPCPSGFSLLDFIRSVKIGALKIDPEFAKKLKKA